LSTLDYQYFGKSRHEAHEEGTKILKS